MSDHSEYGQGSQDDYDNLFLISPHTDLNMGIMVKLPIDVPISCNAIIIAYDIYKYYGFLWIKYWCINLDVYKNSDAEAKTTQIPANSWSSAIPDVFNVEPITLIISIVGGHIRGNRSIAIFESKSVIKLQELNILLI